MHDFLVAWKGGRESSQKLKHRFSYIEAIVEKKITMNTYIAERRDVLGCTMYIPGDQEISRGSRDVSRAKSESEGNLEVRGNIQPNPSEAV